MRKTQLSLWLREAPGSRDNVASFVKVPLSRSVVVKSLSKVRLASSTWLLASLTGFAVLGELEAQGVSRLSKFKSSNMSTSERTIQDMASKITNAF